MSICVCSLGSLRPAILKLIKPSVYGPNPILYCIPAPKPKSLRPKEKPKPEAPKPDLTAQREAIKDPKPKSVVQNENLETL